jgi:dTDP-4-amino-4,6-dideoxygalactose transaminase
VIDYDERERCNYQYIVLELDEKLAPIGRDDLLKVLHAENVLARRYFYPGCHRMEPYRSYFPHARLLLPKTEEVAARVVCLPTGPTLQQDDILAICQIIRLALSEGDAIPRHFAGIGRQPHDTRKI